MIKKTLVVLTLSLCALANIAQAKDQCATRLKTCMEKAEKPNCAAYTVEGPGASRGQIVCEQHYVKKQDKEEACRAGCAANGHADRACENPGNCAAPQSCQSVLSACDEAEPNKPFCEMIFPAKSAGLNACEITYKQKQSKNAACWAGCSAYSIKDKQCTGPCIRVQKE